MRHHLYALVAVAIVPLAMLLANEVRRQTAAERLDAEREATLAARLVAAHAESFVSDTVRSLTRLAQRPKVAALDETRCDSFITEWRELTAQVSAVATLSATGNAVCVTPDPLPGGMREVLATVAGTVTRERRGHWAGPVVSEASGGWLLTVAMPVGPANGPTAGAMALAIDLDRFRNNLAQLPHEDGLQFLLVDEAGVVLAAWPGEAAGVGTTLPGLDRGAAVAGLAAALRTWAQGRGAEFVGLAPVRASGWTVLATMPAGAAVLTGWQSALYLSVIGLAVLLVLAATRYLRRRVEVPFAAMVAAAKAAGQGDLTMRVPESGPADVAQLGRQFNVMLDALAQQRKSLEDSQARLQGVLRAVQEAIYSTSPDGARLYFVSHAIQNIIGRSPAELYGNVWQWQESVVEGDRARLKGRIEVLTQTGAFETQYRIRHADGTERWVQDRAWLIRDEKGRPLRIDGIVSDVSERWRAERALRQSEQRFRSIAESSPVPLSIVGYPSGMVRYVNRAFCDAFDIDPADALERESIDLYAEPQDRERLMDRLREEGQLTNIEAPLRRRDGRIFWVVVSARLSSLDGEPVVLTAYVDITARKQAEQSLKASEERFRSLVSVLAEGVVLHDAAGRIVTCNGAAERALRLSRDRLVGATPAAPGRRLVHEDGSEMAPDEHPAMVSLATGRALDDCVLGMADETGDTVWLSMNARPLFYPQAQRAYAVVVSFSDITAARRAERALRKSRAQLGGIISSAMDGVITIDQAQRVTLFNAAAERMFGVSAQQVIGHGVDRFIPESLREAHAAHVRRFGETGVTTRRMGGTTRVTGLRADGESFPIEASISQIELDGEHFYTVILRDVTDRERAEREVLRLNERLEQRVAERTAELVNANRELEAFSYSVSHDLRAPLRSINGFAHILEETERHVLSEEGRELLSRIMTSAVRMGQLIDDILLFSRISRTEMQCAEVDLTALARAVVDELAQDYPAARINLTPLGRVSGDPAMLRQALVNLVGNALKFSSRQDAPVVEIGATGTEGHRVCFVRDNGAGFDPQHAARLFGVFQRLHSAGEFPGTGVGLAIVKRILDRHKGRIWAEAAVGRGATFYFSFDGGPDRPDAAG